MSHALKLRQPVPLGCRGLVRPRRIGDDVNDRVGMDEARGRDRWLEDGLHGRNRRARELHFQLMRTLRCAKGLR